MAGANFGTGSSREHAVWAIADYGFKAVMSPRFGDIFRNNATKNGLVPVVVSNEVGEQLLRAVEADPTLEITVDVRTKRLSAPAIGLDVEFPLDDATQHRFLNGLDDIGITLANEAAITAYEATRPSWMPQEHARRELSDGRPLHPRPPRLRAAQPSLAHGGELRRATCSPTW